MRNQQLVSFGFAGGEMSVEMYSRGEDPKFRFGAALVSNMVCEASGGLSRRPGSRFISRTKDPANRSVLFPFRYSGDKGYALSFGRATVSGRSIGHVRMHQDGKTLMHAPLRSRVIPIVDYSLASSTSVSCAATTLTVPGTPLVPNAHIGHTIISEGSYATVTSNTSSVFTFTGGWVGGTPTSGAKYSTNARVINDSKIYFTTAHGFLTGDPVRVLMTPRVDVTFELATFRIKVSPTAFGGVSALTPVGTPVVFSGSAIPTGIEAYRIYYVSEAWPTYIRIASTRGGQSISFSTTGTAVQMSAYPVLSKTVGGSALLASDSSGFSAITTLYAIALTSTSLQLAETRSAAISGTPLYFKNVGIGPLNIHYAYDVGDTVFDTGTSNCFYCMKRPHGPDSILAEYIWPGLYGGLSVSDTTHWYQLPAVQKPTTVTVDPATDRITWASHGGSNGEPVTFATADGLTDPGGVPTGQTFFIRNKTTNDFQLSATPCGDIVNITSTGTAVYACRSPYLEMPHYYSDAELDQITHVQSNDVMTIASRYRPPAEIRRYSTLKWQLQDIQIGAQVAPPRNLTCTQTLRGQTIIGTSTNAASKILTCATDHGFGKNETVYLTESSFVPDGLYTVRADTGLTLAELVLLDINTGIVIIPSGTGPDVFLISASPASAGAVNNYRVTAIDAAGVESVGSNEISVVNNLFVSGSKNYLSWSASPGAVGYNIYKKAGGTGSYGRISSSESTTYVEETAIVPDLTKPLRIQDTSLSRYSSVTFNTTTNEVVVAEGHGMFEGSPLVFDAIGSIPSGLEIGKTYFALNVGPTTYQVSASETSSTVVVFGTPGSGLYYVKSGNFPASVTYIEGRRAFGGGLLTGQRVVMTTSNTESDLGFAVPVSDSDRISFSMATRNTATIRHLVPVSHLMLMTNVSEVRLTPLNNDALTPTSVSVRPQTYVGCDYPQPEIVNSNIVFAEARGGHVRELGFSAESGGYSTGDLCLRAPHLFDGYRITKIALQKSPHQIVWMISNSQKMLGLTYVPEEQVGAWHQHSTDGVIESLTTNPEGGDDAVYISVARTVGGSTVRSIEYIEGFRRSSEPSNPTFVDCCLTYDGPGQTTFGGFDHLEGRTIRGTADGVAFTKTVVGGSFSFTASVKKLAGGLGYTSEVQTLPLAAQTGSAPRNINKLQVRVKSSGRFKAGPLGQTPTTSMLPVTGLLTGLVPVPLPGSWSADGQVFILQDEPLPLNIIGIVAELSSGGTF
jgi:hypothetical protein